MKILYLLIALLAVALIGAKFQPSKVVINGDDVLPMLAEQQPMAQAGARPTPNWAPNGVCLTMVPTSATSATVTTVYTPCGAR